METHEMTSLFDALPDAALIRQAQLIPLLPFKAATLWRRVKLGQFPAPIRLEGGRVTAWRVGEVRHWLGTQGGKS
ncbi:MAG: AlpA family phage regulatory protein [Sphingomonadales bacterium]|nr:MAG: AlpA family phage regulatory protein [Sphingomonadales bacterium]